MALGKTGRGVGAGDEWVKPGDGNWEIDHKMHPYSQLARGQRAPVLTRVTSCLDLHKALTDCALPIRKLCCT